MVDRMSRKPPFDCMSCPCFVPHIGVNVGGTCHFGPPQSHVLLGQHPVTREVQPNTLCTYPGVGKGDWCAQHPSYKSWSDFQPKLMGDVMPITLGANGIPMSEPEGNS